MGVGLRTHHSLFKLGTIFGPPGSVTTPLSIGQASGTALTYLYWTGAVFSQISSVEESGFSGSVTSLDHFE